MSYGGQNDLPMLLSRNVRKVGGQKRMCNDFSPPLLSAQTDNMPPCVVLGLDRASFNQGQNAQFDFSILEDEQPTLTAKGPGAIATNGRQPMSSGLQGRGQSICESRQTDNRGGANG